LLFVEKDGEVTRTYTDATTKQWYQSVGMLYYHRKLCLGRFIDSVSEEMV